MTSKTCMNGCAYRMCKCLSPFSNLPRERAKVQHDPDGAVRARRSGRGVHEHRTQDRGQRPERHTVAVRVVAVQPCSPNFSTQSPEARQS